MSIVGLGLIGGSAGIALRAAGHTVVGYARRVETRRRALEVGAADETPAALSAAAQADVVLLATPVLTIRQVLGDLAPHVAAGTVVTDAASTKGDVERWALRLLPTGVHWVGGHPMAGKETAGINFADGALFRGRTWCIVPPAGADASAVSEVARLAGDTGARAVLMGAEAHDRAVAATSHLPFAAAAALALAVIARDGFADLAAVAGSGLRDMTRLASGDPIMHRDICLTNRDHLVPELEAYARRVAELAEAIRRLPSPDDAARRPDDPALAALEARFAGLKRARDAWLAGE